MKNLLIILTAISLLFVFSACGDKRQDEDFTSKIVKDLESTPNVEQETPNPLGFENVKLYSAVCKALGKNEKNVTQEDILSIKYIAIGPETTGECTVYVGLSDYIDAYFEAVTNPEDEQLSKKMLSLVKIAPLEVDMEKDDFSDVAKFTNVNVFEYYNIPINDVSFLKDLDELYFGYFKNNGITDVSCLDGYNPETLRELDFTGNNIEDWTVLEPIKEKVVVHYEMREYDNGNGEKLQMPIVITLEEKIKQDKEREEQENNPDNNQQPSSFVDENGNAVDFGSLFE